MKLFRYIVIKILNFFDNFKSKKIFIILKKFISQDSIIFDVGSHYGETILLINKFLKPKEVYSFEISRDNFEIMKNIIKKKKFFFKIYTFNYGFSDKKKIENYFQAEESSSSTISNINKESKYFKRKMKILFKKESNNFFKIKKCQLDTLSNFFINNNLKKIDLLKIDTEGHEYKILHGANDFLKKIHLIYFEHHYDNMLEKNYKFSDINNLLIKNGFVKIYKSKMFFRKTFEYVYKNYNFNS